MAVTINGTTGIAGVDGSAGTPAVQGADSNTGIFFPAADTIAFAEGGAEVARFDSSGNFGIGTSSPGQRVQLGNNTTSTEMIRFASTTANFDIGMTSSGCEVGTVNNQPILFRTNAAERARIDSSGNLLVGTTSSDPIGAKVKGITLNPGNAQVTVMADNARAMALGRFTGTGNLAEFFYYGGGLAAVGSISTNGSTTSFNTTSDYRLKDNIAPMTGALAKISALKPVTYTWKSTGEADEGFIAHELQEVCPSAVNGVKDAVDAEGNPQYQGIDTSFLVATLTAAIQELKAINDAQAETITALTARVTALEGA